MYVVRFVMYVSTSTHLFDEWKPQWVCLFESNIDDYLNVFIESRELLAIVQRHHSLTIIFLLKNYSLIRIPVLVLNYLTLLQKPDSTTRSYIVYKLLILVIKTYRHV